MTRPVSVTIAMILVWIGAILMLLNVIGVIALAFGFRDPEIQKEIESALVANGLSENAENYFTFALWTAAAIMLISGIVRIVLAIYLGRGYNWARIVITIFVVIGFIASLSTIFSGGWNILAGLIGCLIEVIILGLLWNARASVWFRDSRMVRHAD
ncbi:MAG: hypothetical protein ACKOT0_06370 [bacterium]